MSATTHASAPETPVAQKLNEGATGFLGNILLGAGILLLALVFGYVFYNKSILLLEQFAHSYLWSFYFYFTISCGVLFWILLHHAVDADWTVVVRRILEKWTVVYYALPVLLVPILLCNRSLYQWTRVGVQETDFLFLEKAGYFTGHVFGLPFFWLRLGFYALTLIGFGWIYRTFSMRQDLDGSVVWSWKMRCWSFAGIPALAITVTFFAVDFLMSLDHHWYSTMWGVYIFAGSLQSSMAVLILVNIVLQRAGYLTNVVSKEHFHIMGKLLLAFTIFWAYVAFSQYMLIWYANIPEETTFYLERNRGTWWYASVFLVFGHFVVPFLGLLLQSVKKNFYWMLAVTSWVLFMHAFDLYWIILPRVHKENFTVHPLSVLSVVGMGAILVGIFIKSLGRGTLYPIRDPRLKNSLKLVN
jgi:hypothetical protein